jgi:hypothetical protein
VERLEKVIVDTLHSRTRPKDVKDAKSK